MSDTKTVVRKVKVLKELVARKIAAGEVIDRPLSVLRELLDNALDAKARCIEVRLEDGGLKSLQVVDDGGGMGEDDLRLCWLPHATSKIETEDDLNHLFSLGFRGEALASIAACSRLTITSATDSSGLAVQLSIENSESPVIRKTSGTQGTRVMVEDLFYNIPARKNFMKSPATELTMCRRTLEDKAVSFPQVEFVLWADGRLKVQYPVESPRERLLKIADDSWKHGDLVDLIHEQEGFSLRVFALKPPSYRSDRKDIHIFANNRPLQEFSLVQAVCHAFEGFLPGGAFPQAYVFLQVEPHLVDFNIHPAKREARFRNLPLIHHALTSKLKECLAEDKLRLPLFQRETAPVPLALELAETPAGNHGHRVSDRVYYPDFPYETLVRAQTPDVSAPRKPAPDDDRFRYLGQIMGVFLLAELDDRLYMIDQHAAHERILYEKFQARKNQTQELLIPLMVHPDPEVITLLVRDIPVFEAMGIGIRQAAPQVMEVWKIPQAAAHLQTEIVRFLQDYRKPAQDLEKSLYANLACRSAVMDGDPLDPTTARELIRQTFALEDARCPHGRPVWFAISRQELFEKVARII